MSYSISDLKLELNNEAQSILSDIDAMIEFCGRKPERVTLLAIQFDRIKAAACSALKKKIHSEAKANEGGKRLKNGTMNKLLDDSDHDEIKEAVELNYKGVIIKPMQTGVLYE